MSGVPRTGKIAVTVRSTPLKCLDTNRELLQTGYWGTHKIGFGWDAHGFLVSCKRRSSFTLLVLTKVVGASYRFAYVPYGLPEIEPVRRAPFLEELGRALGKRLPPGTIFVRFDVPWGTEGAGALPCPLRGGKRLSKAIWDVQPASTVIVDVRGSEQSILDRMKPKTRYNVRLASKKGVEVVDGGIDDLSTWYRLYRETAQRDRISIHARSYYLGLLELAGEYGAGAPDVRLLFARVEGETVGGIIVAMLGERAWYLFGASSGRHRNRMPTYALQWRAMQIARERGCVTYDLCGIPATSDSSESMHGLYRFKTGFGGTILNRYGCYDYAIRRGPYVPFRLVEAIRWYYHKDLVKRALRRRRTKH